MYFYRVENKDGKGPYTNGKYCYSISRIGWNTKQHSPKHNNHGPMECEDLKDVELDKETMIFGFTTLKQLESWFTATELVNLYDEGFKIVRVKGQLVKASKYQAIFKRL